MGSKATRDFPQELKDKGRKAVEATKGLHVIKNLAKYLKGCWKWVVWAWVLVAAEVVCEVLIPTFSQNLISVIEASEAGMDWGALCLWSGLMILLAVCSCATGIAAGFLAAKASARFGRNLRQAMYYKIQGFSFANIDKFSTPSLVTRLTTDVTNIQNSVQMILRSVVRSPLMLVFAYVMASLTEWRLALVYIAIIPVLFFALIVIANIAHPTFVKVFTAYDDLNSTVMENLKGIRVVKSFAKEDKENEKFGRISKYIRIAFIRAEKVLAFNSPVSSMCVQIAVLVVSYFGAKIIIANGGGGNFQVANLTAMFTYNIQILTALSMLSMGYVMIIISRNSAERITQVLSEESEIVSPENPVCEIASGQIDFEHVNFRYTKTGSKDVLHDIDLHIPSGSTVGIIGATGSSKSTLVSLIARLYDVNEGAVKVGGKNVKEYDLTALRDAVAVVLQKNVLFSGTIKSNLCWGKEDATFEEMQKAAKLACADEFIEQFPNKYDTNIEEGGSNVSGGQKQRLCIARALLKSPKILILDDSTSAVDTATDAYIRESFKTHIPEVTKLIIAQRILSIKDCDIIVVMDDGKISAIGNHEQLLQSSDVYKEITETQLGGGDFDAA